MFRKEPTKAAEPQPSRDERLIRIEEATKYMATNADVVEAKADMMKWTGFLITVATAVIVAAIMLFD